MKNSWLILAILAAATTWSCSDDTGANGSGGYAQVGDVALGDDATGVNDGSASETLVGTDATSDSGPQVDTAPKADTGPSKYPDCLSLIGCVAQGCSASNWANGCDSVCLTGASPSVATAYASVSGCIQNTCRDGICNGSTDSQCMNTCIGQKCMGKIAVCGADGKSGAATCASYFTCSDACKSAGSQALACISNCYAAMSATAQGEYGALDACVSAAGGADAFGSCPQQALTCLAGGASGSKSCLDALVCSGGCNVGTDTQKSMCMSGCWSQTTPAGQGEFAAAMKCNGPNKTGCVDSMLACLEPSGTGTCTGSLTCMQGCNQTDGQAKAACSYGCLHSTSPAEAKKNLELQVCMGGCNCNGVQTCDNACLTGPCKTALATCQAP